MKNILQTLRATLGQIGHAVAVLIGRFKGMIEIALNKTNPKYRSLAYTGSLVAAIALLLAELTGIHSIVGFLVAIFAVLAIALSQDRDDDPRVDLACIVSVLVGGGIALFLSLITLFW